MMSKVSFTHGDSEESCDNPHFVVTNSLGDYLSLGNPNRSNYQGFYIKRDGKYYKILSNLVPHADTEELKVGKVISRITGPKSFQKFALFDEGMLSTVEGDSNILLDCKRLYDESIQGREYSVQVRESQSTKGASNSLSRITLINIVYNKKEGDPYSLYVTIATTCTPELKNHWKPVHYSYDDRRGTSNSRWVYEVAHLKGSGKVAVTAGITPTGVQSNALKLLTKQLPKEDASGLPMEAQVALDSLKTLTTKEGIMAGLPWFFHQWSRDELIACGGYLAVGELAPVVSILDKWYGAVRDDGKMPAIYPDEGLDSTDSPGWLGKRTSDFIKVARERNREDLLTDERLVTWRDVTGRMIDSIRNEMVDKLVWTPKNTTWMDTDWGDDGRTGACIEIQALAISLCEANQLLCTMTNTRMDPRRAELMHNILHGVHERMAQGSVIIDRITPEGNPDFTVRPNMFIAWYVAPRMFSKEEWKEFFVKALPEIWLPWGGFSSISKSSELFSPKYTGESVKSYHRGDSWYWVNNLAAIALLTINPDEFERNIKLIKKASIKDMLSMGFVGHCSEVSSAEKQEAFGCWAQAWSASTLLELLSKGSFL